MRSTYAVPASETCSTATRSCSTAIRCSASRDVAPVLSLLSTMRAAVASNLELLCDDSAAKPRRTALECAALVTRAPLREWRRWTRTEPPFQVRVASAAPTPIERRKERDGIGDTDAQNDRDLVPAASKVASGLVVTHRPMDHLGVARKSKQHRMATQPIR